MQFLSKSHRGEGFTEAKYLLLVEAEVQRIRVRYSEGVIGQLWHRAGVPEGCILWEANSTENVWGDGKETLPLVKEGIVELSLVSLKPWSKLTNLVKADQQVLPRR